MLSPPVLMAHNLTKCFGSGCPSCFRKTGPDQSTNVCPDCGTVVACHDIDFDLYPHEVLGIVGESGSGKSTLIRLCHFDWEASAGCMTIQPNGTGRASFEAFPEVLEGRNVFSLSGYRKRSLRNTMMGVVYQNPHLGLRMRVSSGGNIAERLLMAGIRHVGDMRGRAAELLSKTEVPVMRMDEPPINFSGGMQQRVQIAKALSNRPMFLFLDEITTGLDVSVQARVLDLLRELQQEMDVATIVVSHDLGVIRHLTTRTLVMKYGRIVEAGLTDQILEDPQHPYTQLLVSSTL